jgi:carboxyl-terminal processing protease
MRAARGVLILFLVAMTVLVFYGAGFGTHWLLTRNDTPIGASPSLSLAEANVQEEAKGFDVFWEAWHILQRDFFGQKPDATQRTYGAIKGLVETYEDPYTYFIEPQPRQREREELSGEFGGIGAWITQAEDGSFHLDPMPESPAEQAGIQQDDILIAVDGTPITSEMTQEDVVATIRGPIGEVVQLTVQRAGQSEPLAIQVVRDRIETPSVEWRMMEDPPRMGYVRISLFSERTASELDRAIAELEEQGAQQLIVDLRHNSGGLLQASIDVASRFLSDGVVLFERKGDGSETTYRVREAKRAPNWPIAVLVDSATASAAEIVAGALQDRNRATLVGDQTFGKGSVQLVYDLSDGSSVHVTVARWLTPNGHQIDGAGLSPDIPVAHEDTRDAPLEEAMRYLQSGAS